MSILYSRVNRIEDETVEVVGCERGEDETETVLGEIWLLVCRQTFG